jgi:phosphoglycolate phosphatase-like HAD superfamily hydrolase
LFCRCAAVAAGAYAVGVTNSLPAEVLSQHADMVVNSLAELDLATIRGQQQQL